MKQQLANYLLILFISIFISSCVSSLLQEKAPTFSKEISFKSPQESFSKIKTSVYPAWKNTKTGNVISVVSDCAENTTVSFSNLYQLIADSLEKPQLLKQEQMTFKQKPAQFYLTEGSLDGAPILVRSLAFKRKNCGYVSSLSGKPKTLDLDQKSFEDFNESFQFE